MYSYYYFGKNLQGDVIGLYRWNWSEDYRHTMTLVATYDYDPWGKLLSVTDPTGAEITGPTHPANLNPIRYRGYYQDNDTGFYYLQSRYYDPELKRFINADSYASTGQGFIGCNMFTYCADNPITFSDPSGRYYRYMDPVVGPGGGPRLISGESPAASPGWGGGTGGSGVGGFGGYGRTVPANPIDAYAELLALLAQMAPALIDVFPTYMPTTITMPLPDVATIDIAVSDVAQPGDNEDPVYILWGDESGESYTEKEGQIY